MPEVYTPWAHEAELLQVRDSLYKTDDDRARRSAVDCIEMWTMRGNCPHAVSSTAHLTDALLHHRSASCSTSAQRGLFASAFTRFVTGFCDLGQGSRSRTAMADVARVYGMPPSFIALRHDAAHRELPSLPRLERACRAALDWLWGYYWAPLDGRAPLPAQTVKAVGAALKTFLQQRKDEIQQRGAEEAAKICCMRLLELDSQLPGGSRAFGKQIAVALAGMMIPKKRLIGDSMTGAYALFDSLLKLLSRHFDALLPALIDTLMHITTTSAATESDAQREGAAHWIEHVLTGRRWTRGRHVAQVDACKVDVVRRCALATGRAGNEWTERLGRRLLAAGSDDFREAHGMETGAWPD